MKRFLFLLTTGLLIITNESIAAPSEQRRAEALKVFKEYPDKISPEIQEKILAQQVVLGMTPYDAYLAAGAHYYKVSADPEKWKRNADHIQSHVGTVRRSGQQRDMDDLRDGYPVSGPRPQAV